MGDFVIDAGLLVGAINGVLVVIVGIESIIATLGMGSLVAGITLWISHSNMISGISNTLVRLVIVPRLFGISLGFVYAVAIALLRGKLPDLHADRAAIAVRRARPAGGLRLSGLRGGPACSLGAMVRGVSSSVVDRQRCFTRAPARPLTPDSWR